MTTLNDWFQLASGHDNVAGLQALHLIDPPAFLDYTPKGGVLTEWHDGHREERDGNGVLQILGYPNVSFKLYNITVTEWLVIKAYAGEVTAHLFNKTEGTWGDYNGILEFPIGERKWGLDIWDEIGGNIIGLEEI